MDDEDYISYAVKDIIDKHIDGESDVTIYGISMSLIASVYDSTEESNREYFKRSLLDVFNEIDKGEYNDFE